LNYETNGPQRYWCKNADAKTTPNMTPNEYTINFNIKRKTGQRSSVNAVIRIKGQKKVIVATGISVDVADWDSKRGRCKKDESANERLAEKRKELIQQIKRGKIGEKGTGTMKEMIQRKIDTMERTKENNSVKIYKNLLSKIKVFEKDEGKKGQAFTEEYITKLVRYMKANNYSDGYISRLVGAAKTVAKENKIIFETKERPGNRHKDQIYLTLEEIRKIEIVHLEGNEAKVRDFFLVACYTALRYSDVTKANKITNVNGVKVVVIDTDKTGARVGIPAREELVKIIEKYREIGMPDFTNQFINREIKGIAEKAGITEMVKVKKFTGGKTVVEMVPKYKLVTTHTARRSFATNAVLKGIPATVVMRFTGHRSLSQFQRYIKAGWEEAAAHYWDHEFFR
jgi:integrase